MGIREYFKNSGNNTRWKACALTAVFFHAVVLLGGSLVMAQKAEYGMAGAAAGGGSPQVVPTQVEETVELETSSDDSLSERKPKPKPTPVIQTGIGGKVSGQVSEIPAYYRNPPPPYPMSARAHKEEGVVMLHAEVDVQGKVASVSLIQSCGFTDLDEAALEAVKNWQFKPAQIAGIPISTSVNVPIRFRLKDVS